MKATALSANGEFRLTQQEQDELEAAVAEIREGHYTDGFELLRELQGLTTR
jgi:hypothetical protein